MEHYQVKGVIIMIMFVMMSFALGMNGLTDTLLVMIVILLGNILSVLCRIFNKLK